MQWTFNGSMLFSPNGSFWIARSGPYGKSTLPSGHYSIGRAVKLPTSSAPLLMPWTSFTDLSGNAWWCPIKPLFLTDRTGLGIHPDGGIPGTLGCIGIIGNYTLDCFQALDGQHGNILVVE